MKIDALSEPGGLQDLIGQTIDPSIFFNQKVSLMSREGRYNLLCELVCQALHRGKSVRIVQTFSLFDPFIERLGGVLMASTGDWDKAVWNDFNVKLAVINTDMATPAGIDDFIFRLEQTNPDMWVVAIDAWEYSQDLDRVDFCQGRKLSAHPARIYGQQHESKFPATLSPASISHLLNAGDRSRANFVYVTYDGNIQIPFVVRVDEERRALFNNA